LDPLARDNGAVAKKYRQWIGIEKDENYVRIAIERIDELW
jgi:DNA modification methylase